MPGGIEKVAFMLGEMRWWFDPQVLDGAAGDLPA